MAPFDLSGLGTWGNWALSAAIGFGFGFVLESSGFGDARKLAGQFYFRELTVLKVMFTAIVVAAVLVFFSSALGLLDYEQVWVNPTYLWSGIVGGLLLGVGFVIGGYCPGTSLVSAATLKIDGILFVLGVSAGIFLFGETADAFLRPLMAAGSFGRLTLQDWLGLPAGAVLVGVVGMALFMFWGGEKLVARVQKTPAAGRRAPLLAGAAALMAGAVATAAIGQPGPAEKWQLVASKHQPRLDKREVHVDPGELLALMSEDEVKVLVADVRDERDWNQFHIVDSVRVSPQELPALRSELSKMPSPPVLVLVSNDEAAATQAWKELIALGASNAYILSGGINGWLDAYAGEHGHPAEPHEASAADDRLRHALPLALGDRHPAANPDAHHAPAREFVRKVKLQKAGKKAGGCG